MKDGTTRSTKIAKHALELCGVRFRLHGRDVDHGLDCIGLVEKCLTAADFKCSPPNGYSVRDGEVQWIQSFMESVGFETFAADCELRDGDIVLVRPSPVQYHFMIRTNGGFVHAHAGLRKVVFLPGDPVWSILKIFRILEK